jgi:hypothetical protein
VAKLGGEASVWGADGVRYDPGMDVPAEVASEWSNPDIVWDGDAPASDAGDGAAKAPADPSVEPPRSGRGSGVEAWRAHAAHLGVEVPDDASRDDIIAAVDAHNTA